MPSTGASARYRSRVLNLLHLPEPRQSRLPRLTPLCASPAAHAAPVHHARTAPFFLSCRHWPSAFAAQEHGQVWPFNDSTRARVSPTTCTCRVHPRYHLQPLPPSALPMQVCVAGGPGWSYCPLRDNPSRAHSLHRPSKHPSVAALLQPFGGRAVWRGARQGQVGRYSGGILLSWYIPHFGFRLTLMCVAAAAFFINVNGKTST